MTVIIDGTNLTIENVLQVARFSEKIELHPSSLEKIKASRAFIERKIKAKEIMYGVNTGIGELASIVLDENQTKEFQKYLIYNHAAGIGEPAPIEHVRAAMLSRVNVHAKGYSGCRPEITLTYIDMLNKGVIPVVCEKGSVGACGDLSPMSQCALSLMGEGEAFYQGKRMPTRDAMEKAGIPIPGLQARDGLAAINGSNLITGIGCILLNDIEAWTKHAEIAAAMTLEALLANMKPYNTRIHELRGFQGAVKSAANLRAVMNESDLMTGKMKVKVQDAYSMRSTPQVIGALRDQLAHARKQLEIELNGVADNPIFVGEEDIVLTGANFQGTPISLPLDVVGAAVTMVCVLSERRLNRLLNPACSVGLPSFLTKGAGMFSGMMLSQYTADMLISEARILSAPAYVLSIPAAADQEDFVSMGMNSALKTKQILKNSYGVMGIEFMAAAQALDFRDFGFGKGTKAAHSAIRKHVEHLEVDRPLFNDHNAMSALVESGEILSAVEKEVGPLVSSWK
ncbi:MAG TPA: aromatic amino acid ammonia-lyase [Acidobacteriota bacterium]|nr:aromatic amino acid ammonia-lyase [Acidobacteriota bacterium]HNT18446.1 aromatic amino acid ammonia-lyase [Acidobacteriota bacterium]HPA26713.1 aromatic amino acid ammonia-lyase [Acidobacteriota bacterium]HQO20252.1 aromatic amino acid ammonia-lyase [Acidobacteriota bacterium]HQQ46905.1 aromatic amino acid ammonia-lyase [Acidobacteriota bacterium]